MRQCYWPFKRIGFIKQTIRTPTPGASTTGRNYRLAIGKRKVMTQASHCFWKAFISFTPVTF